MQDYNQNPGNVEIVKEAEVNIINDNNNDKALLKVLKNEISHLKASSASLKSNSNTFERNTCPMFFL